MKQISRSLSDGILREPTFNHVASEGQHDGVKCLELHNLPVSLLIELQGGVTWDLIVGRTDGVGQDREK